MDDSNNQKQAELDITFLEGDLDQKMADIYSKASILAIDTETLGLNTQRDRLCLVQLADEEGHITLLRVTTPNAPRLKALLETPEIEKVCHFARFDMAALQHWMNILVSPVFCTKIASRFARTYHGSHSLRTVTHELLGIELDKMQQSSNWGAKTFTKAQMRYAAGDVIHLPAIKTALEEMLKAENRWDLAKACMDFLPTRVAVDLAGWPEDIFSHA
ncbi:ribonuclease D [Magnetococcales bacterium HHB-1]